MLSAIVTAILTFLPLLATCAWWIADAVIFCTNQRLGGDGCPLKSIL